MGKIHIILNLMFLVFFTNCYVSEKSAKKEILSKYLKQDLDNIQSIVPNLIELSKTYPQYYFSFNLFGNLNKVTIDAFDTLDNMHVFNDSLHIIPIEIKSVFIANDINGAIIEEGCIIFYFDSPSVKDKDACLIINSNYQYLSEKKISNIYTINDSVIIGFKPW